MMTAIELKENIHRIVDQIQSEQLLHTVYQFLKKENKPQSAVWTSLTEEQRNEVLLAFEESEDDSNLLDNDHVLKS